METFEIIRLIGEGIAAIALFILSRKTIKYKNIIVEIINAAKDWQITEQEFQKIVDAIRREIYGS
jgi:hypothetical protein